MSSAAFTLHASTKDTLQLELRIALRADAYLAALPGILPSTKVKMGVKILYTTDIRRSRRRMNLTCNRCICDDHRLLSSSHAINTSLEHDSQPHAMHELFHRLTRISLPKVLDL